MQIMLRPPHVLLTRAWPWVLTFVSDAVPTADVDDGSAPANDGGNAVVAETGNTLNLLPLYMKAGVVKQR